MLLLDFSSHNLTECKPSTRHIDNVLLGHYTIPNIRVDAIQKNISKKSFEHRWVFRRLRGIFVFIENWLPCFSHISLNTSSSGVLYVFFWLLFLCLNAILWLRKTINSTISQSINDFHNESEILQSPYSSTVTSFNKAILLTDFKRKQHIN